MVVLEATSLHQQKHGEASSGEHKYTQRVKWQSGQSLLRYHAVEQREINLLIELSLSLRQLGARSISQLLHLKKILPYL